MGHSAEQRASRTRTKPACACMRARIIPPCRGGHDDKKSSGNVSAAAVPSLGLGSFSCYPDRASQQHDIRYGLHCQAFFPGCLQHSPPSPACLPCTTSVKRALHPPGRGA